MSVKTITITTDAYERLRALKLEGESFSETIQRISSRPPLMQFFGVLSEESGKRLEKAIEEGRRARKELDARQ